MESLKGMVSSSESQQQEHAKAQMKKISALQEQVQGLKTSSRKAESECTSLQSQLTEATRKEQEVDVCRHGRASLSVSLSVCVSFCLSICVCGVHSVCWLAGCVVVYSLAGCLLAVLFG